MTCYHGGKQKIGKQLSDIIYNISCDISEKDEFKIKGYCEPFCGMLGVYQHIPEKFDITHPNLIYKAGDLNKSVIMMWQEAQKGWKPPKTISEKTYNKLKSQSEDSALKGYVGHQYGFAGQYFKGYSPNYGKKFDSNKVINNISNIADELFDVSFSYGSYTQFSKLKNYVIYCDPPYSDTYQRYDDNAFNSLLFFNWCRKMYNNNIVFISEYNAPKDFKLIFSKTQQLSGHTTKYHSLDNKQRLEKLYLL